MNNTEIFNTGSNLMDAVIYNGKWRVPLNPEIGYRSIKIPETTDWITIFIDTGVIEEHPWIKGSLLKSIDLTGEGNEDLNGHGTSCALTYLSGFKKRPKIISIKALDKKGIGTERNMIKSFDLAIKLKNENPMIRMINVSAGLYSKHFGFLSCKGQCKICRAATKAVENGIIVNAAAGNTPNRTACPAIAPKVFSIGSVDINNKESWACQTVSLWIVTTPSCT